MDLNKWQQRLQAFAQERDWERFHDPKNLAMALSVEVSELMEHFQWLETGQAGTLDADALEAVRLEMADVQLYLLRMAQQLGIDLEQACEDKFRINQQRYPVEQCRGSAAKYTRYQSENELT